MRLRSLTTRFVLTVLIATAGPFLIFGWIVRGGAEERLNNTVTKLVLAREATLVAREVQTLIDGKFRSCELILRDLERALGERDGQAGTEYLLEALEGQGLDSQFDYLVVVHADGEMAAQLPGPIYRDGQDIQRIESRQLRDFSENDDALQQAWFDAVIQDGLSFFTIDRHLSPWLHDNTEVSSQSPNDYSFGFAFRLGDETPTGVALALFRWSDVQELIDEVAGQLRVGTEFQSVRVELVGREASVRSSSGSRERLIARIERPELVQAIVEPEKNGEVIRGLEDGASARIGVAPVGKTIAGDFGWRCLVAATDRELFSITYEFGERLLLVTALTVAALVLAAFFVSRATLRPVRDLVQATEALADGDLRTRVRVRGRDELSDLAESFNSMARQLEETQSELRKAERNAAWAEMARQVAHEIKNPLTPMRMGAQLLERARARGDSRVTELADRMARTVLEQTEQLARIAEDFRHFAGRPRRDLQPTRPSELLNAVRIDYSSAVDGESGAVVSIQEAEHAEREPLVHVDSTELRRVFLNLVENARQAAGDTGRVDVGFEIHRDRVEFLVRDDGPGIPEDVLPQLFEPYFTTRSSGTGLGLAICRRVIEAHGGAIRVSSSQKGCTEFRFSLPVLASDSESPNGSEA
ncbi:MAG: HAMP domain-containing sensor histidine kinase [Planctomycetota bacterium]